MKVELPITIRRPGQQNPFTPGTAAPEVEEYFTVVLDSEDLKKAIRAALGGE